MRTLRRYIAEQRAATGVVPDDQTLVVEHFRDELGAVRVIVHSIFGAASTRRGGWRSRSGRGALLGGTADVQVQTSDDGIMLRLPDLGARPAAARTAGSLARRRRRRVIEEVGTTPLFGARFRMNAARALLLPRGAPRPAHAALAAAAEGARPARCRAPVPRLSDPRGDLPRGARRTRSTWRRSARSCARWADGRIAVRVVETERPSPFAAGLQFGFVMDWLYADDTPRAERAAALLAIDRESCSTT